LGPQGAVDKQLNDHEVLEGSQGFCVLNNVAVGAAYALSNYRKLVRKVAILDFDVHHGNGTEAIVRNVMENRWRSQVPKYKSVDVGDPKGTHHEIAGTLRMKLPPTMTCKPWLDPSSDSENIFFASIHGFDEDKRFYPGSGKSCSQSSPRVINVALAPGSDSQQWRRSLRREVFPALTAFAPDLIFLSAGFDAHADDPVGNCGLTDDDYVWITRNLASIANKCCQGRLISTLEGGYNTLAENLSPLALSVAGHVRTLISTPLNYRFPRRSSTQPPAPATSLKRSESSDNASSAKRLKLKVWTGTEEATPSEIASDKKKEPSQDASVMTRTETLENLDASDWRVIWIGGVRVRSAPSLEAERVDGKDVGEIVRGIEKDGWVQLINEPGYMMIRSEENVFLQRAESAIPKAKKPDLVSSSHLDSSPDTTQPAPLEPLPASRAVPQRVVCHSSTLSSEDVKDESSENLKPELVPPPPDDEHANGGPFASILKAGRSFSSMAQKRCGIPTELMDKMVPKLTPSLDASPI